MPLIRVAYDAFKDVEERMKFRFGNRERERSNRSFSLAAQGPMIPICPLRHDNMAWAGPPHNQEQMYVCISCGSYATESMIKSMGESFHTVPDYIIHDLMDEVLRQKFAKGNPVLFGGLHGK